jgi:CPA1 family monovalent cation:H+ antiporter
MSGAGIHATQVVLLLLLLCVVAFGALAQRLKTPYPIVLVLAGLLLGFVPGIPRVMLDPELVFLVVLPPLLFSAAWATSWRSFVHNSAGIVSLAVGLVAFTAFGVAAAAPWFFPGVDWRTGFVLGAVVATTDSIAATSIAKRIGLPKRISDVLEGESLVNDATGLLALEFATAMLVYGQVPSIGEGFVRFIYLAVAGIAVGMVLARIVEWFEYRVDDAPIEIAISIFVPYTTYLAAEAIHASGVLAVVASGLYLSRRSSRFFSPSVRIQANAVWNSLTFILNGVVFLLIGLQLPYVLGAIKETSVPRLLLYGGIFSAFVIVLRLLWTFPSAYLVYFVRKRILHQSGTRPGARQLFVVGWTGMRGVIALAAALSVPATLEDGSQFPHRSLIVFLTFSVILVTLVLQGLTLPPLIRALGLAGGASPHAHEEEARRLVLEAALEHLEKRRDNDLPEKAPLYKDLERHYRDRLANVNAEADEGNEMRRKHYAHYLDLSRELLNVERKATFKLLDQGRIEEEVARELEQELDLSEVRLSAAMEHQLEG